MTGQAMTALVADPRDEQVVSLLLHGSSNQEIAEVLGIKAGTVKQRLRALYLRAGIAAGRKRIRLIEILSDAEKKPLPKLSSIELRIAEFAIDGRTNGHIAEILGTSEQIVKNHMRLVFDKCGVWSRAELAARFRCRRGEGDARSNMLFKTRPF